MVWARWTEVDLALHHCQNLNWTGGTGTPWCFMGRFKRKSRACHSVNYPWVRLNYFDQICVHLNQRFTHAVTIVFFMTIFLFNKFIFPGSRSAPAKVRRAIEHLRTDVVKGLGLKLLDRVLEIMEEEDDAKREVGLETNNTHQTPWWENWHHFFVRLHLNYLIFNARSNVKDAFPKASQYNNGRRHLL